MALNFEEISPPYIVKEDALYGTGQLPKFSDDLFKTIDNRWLIPTSEVPLTNIVSNEIIDKKTLSNQLEITAETKDGIIMGIMHKKYNIHGVQFHPESIKTILGIKILKNFINYKNK